MGVGVVTSLTTSSGIVTAKTGVAAVAHAVVVGDTTNGVAMLTVGTDGQLMIGQTGANPAFTTISGAFTLSAAGVATPGSTIILTDGSHAFAADQSMGSHKLTNLANGSASTDAATYGQLTTLINGATWKAPVKLLAHSNITLSGEQTIDGTLTSATRVGVVGQSTASQNGIYTTAAGSWVRTDDLASGASAASIAFFVEQGSTYADTQWICTSDPGSDVVGTNNLTFAQFGAGTSYTADESTLHLTGTVFSIISTYTGQTSIVTLGTIATGVWQGTVVGSTYGGTGVNNAGRTLTIAANSGTISFTSSVTLTVAAAASVSGTNTGDQSSVSGNAGTATALQNVRTIWGQNFDGTANVTGSLTAVGDITGGASSMTITAGTGNSRTLTLRSTTSGGTATAFLTGNADQSSTFGGNISGTGAWTLTGGAGNMTLVSGTGNSRTMIFQTTTSGGAATTALTLGADQSATFAAAMTQSGGAVSITGNAASSLTTSSGALTITSAAATTFSTMAGIFTLTGGAGLTLGLTGQPTVVNGSTIAGQILVTPALGVGGRLSLSTGVWLTTADVTAATTLFYTPGGNLAGGHNKTIRITATTLVPYLTDFTEMSIKLTDSSQTGTMTNGTKVITGLTDTSQLVRGMQITGTSVGAASVIATIDSATQVTGTVNSTGGTTNAVTFKLPASKNFDIFDHAGKLKFGPAWTSDILRSNNLGTAFGLTLSGSVIGSGDSNSIPADEGMYLGTVRVTTTAGQTAIAAGNTTTKVGGQIFVWNMFNRLPRSVSVWDATDTWAGVGTSSAYRIMDGATQPSNCVEIVLGLVEEIVHADALLMSSDSSGFSRSVGVGIDSGTVNSAQNMGIASAVSVVENAFSIYNGYPSIGYHYIACLEVTNQSGATTTFYGDANIAFLRSGLTATVWC